MVVVKHRMSETGISIDSSLPLGWEPESAPSAAITELRCQSNIALMQALTTIESSAQDHEHNMPEAVRKSLERVESKLDVLLLLVAKLTREAIELPPEKPVNLHPDRITWQETSATPPKVSQTLLIRLFLSPRIPQPLLLPVTVCEVIPQTEGVRVIADFCEISEESMEWITRTIFRYHRRAVQASRQP